MRGKHLAFIAFCGLALVAGALLFGLRQQGSRLPDSGPTEGERSGERTASESEPPAEPCATLIGECARRLQLARTLALPKEEKRQYITDNLDNLDATVRSALGHKKTVTKIIISPDSKTIVAHDLNRNVIVWDLETGAQRYALPGEVADVAIGPGGKTLFSSGGKDGKLSLWDLETGQLLHVFKENLPPGYSLWTFAVSPDGSVVVTNTLAVWNLKTRQLRLRLKGYPTWASRLIISPDSRTIVAAGRKDLIGVWDLETGALRHLLSGHAGRRILRAAIGPDSKTLLSGHASKDIKLWDLETGEVRLTLQKDIVRGERLQKLAISPDGSMAIAATSRETDVWNLETGRLAYSLAAKGKLDLDSSGRVIAGRSFPFDLGIWDLQTGELLHELDDMPSAPFSVAISPDRYSLVIGHSDATLRIWQPVGP